MDVIRGVLLTLLALYVLAYVARTWRDFKGMGGVRLVVKHRVLVNLDTGRTFGGVMWCKTGDWLVLRNAEMIERGQAGMPIDGEVVIERARVEFVQAF